MGSSGEAGERNGSRAEIGSTAGRGMGHDEVALRCITRGLAGVSSRWRFPGIGIVLVAWDQTGMTNLDESHPEIKK